VRIPYFFNDFALDSTFLDVIDLFPLIRHKLVPAAFKSATEIIILPVGGIKLVHI